MKLYVEPPLEREIKNALYNELILQLNYANNLALPDIIDRVRGLTHKLISNGDFAAAFTGPELRGSFGIRPNQYKSRIQTIIQEIVDDTHVFSNVFKLSAGKIEGGWIFAMGSDLFAKLKNTPAAITRTKKGVDVPWLKWTLEVGNAVVISDFKCHFQLGKGRSGFAHMIPDKVIGYRVPPNFSGTNYDNWITREIIPHLDKYADIILRTLNRYAK